MTFRPYQKALSRRQTVGYNKAVRALAHKDGLTAHEAVTKLNGYKTLHRDKPWIDPHHLQEAGLFYISHVKVDDPSLLSLTDSDVYDFRIDFPAYEEPKRQTDMTVSLLDIAKPSKRKGQRKKVNVPYSVKDPAEDDLGADFEHFIDLDGFSTFSEDWENIENEI